MKHSSNSNFNFPTDRFKKEQHPFHLVDPSPWPFMTSIAFSGFLVFIVQQFNNRMYMDKCYMGMFVILAGYSVYNWFFNIVKESTFQGHHTFKVTQGLRYGMVLFILSEVMFFFSFFWAFFHSALAPTTAIGCVWPPVNTEVLDPWGVPLLNTVILLSSGVTVTWAHRAMISGSRWGAVFGLGFTVLLGLLFTYYQAEEYNELTYNLWSGIYGSLFFMCTGFHGFHVLIGTLFLFVCYRRQKEHHFTKEHHFGFEAAAWYWHFVDVVWLFLFVVIYWWGGPVAL